VRDIPTLRYVAYSGLSSHLLLNIRSGSESWTEVIGILVEVAQVGLRHQNNPWAVIISILTVASIVLYPYVTIMAVAGLAQDLNRKFRGEESGA